jgi:hypothetical protein
MRNMGDIDWIENTLLSVIIIVTLGIYTDI